MTNPVAVEVPASIQEDENMDISPIEPNAYALALARTYCRTQMAKIVLEVLYLLVMATGVFAYLFTNRHAGGRCGRRPKPRLRFEETFPLPKSRCLSGQAPSPKTWASSRYRGWGNCQTFVLRGAPVDGPQQNTPVLPGYAGQY